MAVNGRTFILPVQESPSPSYPALQVHENPPSVFWHDALSSQSSKLSSHSSISARRSTQLEELSYSSYANHDDTNNLMFKFASHFGIRMHAHAPSHVFPFPL